MEEIDKKGKLPKELVYEDEPTKEEIVHFLHAIKYDWPDKKDKDGNKVVNKVIMKIEKNWIAAHWNYLFTRGVNELSRARARLISSTARLSS